MSAPLARPEILEALRGTIAYRLEPDGPGTRFPRVGQLLKGRLEARGVGAARLELSRVAAELAQLGVDQVVVSVHDLRRPEVAPELAAQARDAAALFRASDGRLLLEALRDELARAEAAAAPLVVAGQALEVGAARREGATALALGLATAAVARALAPDAVLLHGLARHGPLVWPLGLALAGYGALRLLGASRPSLGERLHGPWALLAGLCFLGALVALAWR